MTRTIARSVCDRWASCITWWPYSLPVLCQHIDMLSFFFGKKKQRSCMAHWCVGGSQVRWPGDWLISCQLVWMYQLTACLHTVDGSLWRRWHDADADTRDVLQAICSCVKFICINNSYSTPKQPPWLLSAEHLISAVSAVYRVSTKSQLLFSTVSSNCN